MQQNLITKSNSMNKPFRLQIMIKLNNHKQILKELSQFISNVVT